MKILFVAPHEFFSIRGTPLAEKRLFEIFCELGYDVSLVTYPYGQNIELNNLRIHRTCNIPFIKNIPAGFSVNKIIQDIPLFFSLLKIMRMDTFQLLHCVEESLFLGIILKKLFKIPLVYDMDSLLSEQLASSGIIRSSFARRIAESIELRAIKEADAVLTMCPALTNYVKSKFPSKAVEHILDFPYYAEESKVLPEEAALVKSELGCIQKPIFMYVGNFRQCQGVELMIQGFIEGVVKPGEKGSLVVVGGDSKRLSYFRKNTREQGLSNRIIFTGQKAPELVRVYLENSWALLSPRLYGLNTPMKVYEYLGAGKPIIATRIPAHSQILNDDTVIFVDPSVTSLAAGFRILLRNHQHANVLCEKSLTTFRKLRETHSKQRAIEIIQRIYSGAITKQHQHLHGSPQRQQLDNAPEIY